MGRMYGRILEDEVTKGDGRMLQTGTLILGGSYAAIGCACAAGDSILLIEHESLGEDYSGVLRPSARCEATDAAGKELYAFFEENGVLDAEGRLDVLRSATTVCRFVREKGLRVLLDAPLVSLEKREDGLLATCQKVSGLREIHAARVLDAGFLRVSDRKAVRVMENRLHVTCLSAGEEAPRVEGGEAAAGFFPREWFVSFRFAPEVSLPEARLSVQRRWQAAFPSGECLIEAMSPDFDAVAVPDGGEGICPWLPPHDTDTPIAAFERGAAWAKEVCAR